MAQPKPVNKAVSGLLRTPVTPNRKLLRDAAPIPGRKTGRLYTIPVGYYRDSETALTTTDGRWWRNLQSPAAVSVLLKRRWYEGVGEAIQKPEETIAGMATLVKGCPRYAGWIEVGIDQNGEPSTEDLMREVRNGRVLIRIRNLRRGAGQG